VIEIEGGNGAYREAARQKTANNLSYLWRNEFPLGEFLVHPQQAVQRTRHGRILGVNSLELLNLVKVLRHFPFGGAASIELGIPSFLHVGKAFLHNASRRQLTAAQNLQHIALCRGPPFLARHSVLLVQVSQLGCKLLSLRKTTQ
jgi:hypothetical protein